MVTLYHATLPCRNHDFKPLVARKAWTEVLQVGNPGLERKIQGKMLSIGLYSWFRFFSNSLGEGPKPWLCKDGKIWTILAGSESSCFRTAGREQYFGNEGGCLFRK